jgi:hypothetical protein
VRPVGTWDASPALSGLSADLVEPLHQRRAQRRASSSKGGFFFSRLTWIEAFASVRTPKRTGRSPPCSMPAENQPTADPDPW